MLSFGPATRILLHTGVTDMRKSFNGLSALVRNELSADPLSGHVFGFCNRRRNLVKLIVWDGSGYWVLAKRLEKGKFSWPAIGDRVHKLRQEELTLLLGGIDLRRTKRKKWHRYSVDRQPSKKEVVVARTSFLTPASNAL